MIPFSCFVDELIKLNFVHFPSRPHELRKRCCSGFSIQGQVFLDKLSNVSLGRHPEALGFARKLRHRLAGKTFHLKTCSISSHLHDPLNNCLWLVLHDYTTLGKRRRSGKWEGFSSASRRAHHSWEGHIEFAFHLCASASISVAKLPLHFLIDMP